MQIIYEALKESRVKKSNPIILYVEKRISEKTNRSTTFNKKLAGRIFLEMVVLGLVYLIYSYTFFHGIWYLNAMVIISTLIFLSCYLDLRLEQVHKKTQEDIPRTTRKLRFYLLNTGNINRALEKTIEKAPDTTKRYLQSMKDATESQDVKLSMDKVKKEIKAEWLKMVCNLVSHYKEHGDAEGIVTQNLGKVTNIIEFINLQQGLDNASIMSAQMFVFFGPIIALPAIEAFNKQMLAALESPVLIEMESQKAMAAVILLLSNIFTLFISWVRKSS
jgi:hypothetical protein